MIVPEITTVQDYSSSSSSSSSNSSSSNNNNKNNNNNTNTNNNDNNNLPETRKYWVAVQRGIVSSHGEKDPLLS